jgi:hypothetical protein
VHKEGCKDCEGLRGECGAGEVRREAGDEDRKNGEGFDEGFRRGRWLKKIRIYNATDTPHNIRWKFGPVVLVSI